MALLAMVTSGCIIIPVPRSTKDEGVRGTFGHAQVEFIRNGETTRRDVLLQLGEPDEIHFVHSRSYDVYVADVSRGDVHIALLVPGRGAGGTFRTGSRDLLLLRYGGDGIVEKHTFSTMRYRIKNDLLEFDHTVPELIQEWEQSNSRSPKPRMGRR